MAVVTWCRDENNLHLVGGKPQVFANSTEANVQVARLQAADSRGAGHGKKRRAYDLLTVTPG